MNRLEATAKVFRALANPRRLALFERLRASALRCRDESRGEMCVCDIADGVALSLSTVSHHLKALKDAGLIRCVKRGQWVFCAVDRDALRRIEAFARGARRAPQPAGR